MAISASQSVSEHSEAASRGVPCGLALGVQTLFLPLLLYAWLGKEAGRAVARCLGALVVFGGKEDALFRGRAAI